ncbi:Cys-tRNA(Pro)/Cys-tRNA(Cys) deacylase [Fictibacillus enclensis]|uniref:Cys-tRNA(Pro)/Cys-tRNA(Cys) deacylase n=1 Tax=Fictibacillus enclensis TaxID=1017270 RepID=A0A0V8JFV3_9BACL|nr:Cys-tRNA(Pro) deacylase [Fictibacillus enclensis]KSU85915.1 aminoacyl-tRNA deacylase [Fictibacillus enclensis]SCB78437.1 Cys-tRNA(Pro)/Cys-tRNA(Cys) deacylase [Fictibacillus enclensis]
MKKVKTNAMRILDKEKIDYESMNYSTDDGKIDGVSVARKIGREPGTVYKTLVAQGAGKEYYVFVIPVEAELDLKKAAKAAGEKKVEMLAVKDLLPVTGYVRGGCSPIGMKKLYSTIVEEQAAELETVIVSAGKIGHQVELSPQNLMKVTNGRYANVSK